MIVMGINHWDQDMPRDGLVAGALEFADDVKRRGIAELRDFLLAHDRKVLWCSWETDDLNALQAAFDEMNARTGLVSTLTPVDDMMPTRVTPV